MIPFVAAIFFYGRDGNLNVDIFLFKSIMIVVGSISAAILLVLYFKKVKGDFLREGVKLGVVWFVMNIGLDLLILIPMSGMSYGDYFMQIGIRYLVIPVMTIMVGVVLKDKN